MFIGRLLLNMLWISWLIVWECLWEENLVFVLNVWEWELGEVFEGVLFVFVGFDVSEGSIGKN